MEVEITKEQKTEDKIYFEVAPTEEELKNRYIFGKEVAVDFNDQNQIELERTKAKEEAKIEFEKLAKTK